MNPLSDRIAAVYALDAERTRLPWLFDADGILYAYKEGKSELIATAAHYEGNGIEWHKQADKDFITAAPEMVSIIRALSERLELEPDHEWQDIDYKHAPAQLMADKAKYDY